VQVERGQFGLVEAWIMESGAAFIRVSEARPARSQIDGIFVTIEPNGGSSKPSGNLSSLPS
jgi:hypothetical protein